MTDQIPADKVREIIAAHRDGASRRAGVILAALEALLPAPPRPTLADMTEEERAACIRMQCDTAPNRSVRGFIADIYPGGCRVIERDTWQWRSCSDDMVTPRPDLPRMEWPCDREVAPAPAPTLPDGWRLADHPRHGRVLVTSPAPDRDGDLWGFRSDDTRLGADRIWCKPAELTYLDTELEADQ